MLKKQLIVKEVYLEYTFLEILPNFKSNTTISSILHSHIYTTISIFIFEA